MVLHGIPDYGVVNAIVTMDDAVAHAYDLADVWILVSVLILNAVKLVERFAQDLELPFNGRTKQEGSSVIISRFRQREFRDRLAGIERIK